MPTRPYRAAVIPARYASTRFPGKPLAMLAGKPMLLHVLERVQAAAVFDEVRVATDDARIAAVVRAAGGQVAMTSAAHTTGTERVAEAAAALPQDAWVYNVQGDEPLLPAALLHELVAFAEADPERQLVTAAFASDDAADAGNPNVVKVVLDAGGRALYFSRAAIPWSRDGAGGWRRHVGIYGFRKATLLRFVALVSGTLERREGLEQLRALEHGIPVHVLETRHASQGVDTPEDLKLVAARLAASLESPGLRHS